MVQEVPAANIQNVEKSRKFPKVIDKQALPGNSRTRLEPDMAST